MTNTTIDLDSLVGTYFSGGGGYGPGFILKVVKRGKKTLYVSQVKLENVSKDLNYPMYKCKFPIELEHGVDNVRVKNEDGQILVKWNKKHAYQEESEEDLKKLICTYSKD